MASSRDDPVSRMACSIKMLTFSTVGNPDDAERRSGIEPNTIPGQLRT